MAINIEMTNTKMRGNSRVIDNLEHDTEEDITIKMSHVDLKDCAKILNYMTDSQADEILLKLKEQQNILEKTDREYQEIQTLLLEVQNAKISVKEVLKQQLPNLFTGTLANIISSVIVRI